MSKSKGNIINPNEVIDRYGADCLRFWAAGSKIGDDTAYHEEDVRTGKRFIIKLRNAANFVFGSFKDYKPKKPKKLEKIDELFLNELNMAVVATTMHFDEYDYSKAKFNADEFFWEFCDNYLEIVKWRVYNGSKQQKESAFYTLYNSLLTILKLIAPIMPFITEEIYQKYYRRNEKIKSIHLSKWPKIETKKIKEWIEGKTFYYILRRVRQEKANAKKSINAEIILTITKKDKLKIKELIEDLRHVTNAKEIREGAEFGVEFIGK